LRAGCPPVYGGLDVDRRLKRDRRLKADHGRCRGGLAAGRLCRGCAVVAASFERALAGSTGLGRPDLDVMVRHSVMDHMGQQKTTFQVLNCRPDLNPAALLCAACAHSGILGRHGPSWAERPTQPSISNAFPSWTAPGSPRRKDVGLRGIGRLPRLLEKKLVSFPSEPCITLLCSEKDGVCHAFRSTSCVVAFRALRSGSRMATRFRLKGPCEKYLPHPSAVGIGRGLHYTKVLREPREGQTHMYVEGTA
jgi:hypothetical protein